MTTVTGLEKSRKTIGISLDGRYVFSIDENTFARFPLKAGDEIDPEKYLEEAAQWQRKNAYEMALSLLDLCDRTEKQIYERLTERGILPRTADETIKRLKANRLIDDMQYAKRMVEIQTGQNIGRYALKRKLLQKGISEENTQQALLGISDEDQRRACAEAAQKLLRRYRTEEPRVLQRKLGQALARRGFSWDDIRAALENLKGTDSEFLNE